jgi:hypothetical protein
MHDKRVEWRQIPFPAAEVKALHEQCDKLRLAAEVKVLRRRQASGVKDSRIRDRLTLILRTVFNNKVNSGIDIIVGEVVVLRHAA